MKIKHGLALAVCVALTACGDGNTPQTAVQGAASAVTEVTHRAVPAADESFPLERYADLNSQPAGLVLSFVHTSRSAQNLTDDQLLTRLSPTYGQQLDSFKKRDIGQAELPKVEDRLRFYGSQDYYSIPIGSLAQEPLALRNVSLGEYDFTAGGFPLRGYTQSCWSTSMRNQQSVYLKIEPGAGPSCVLTVDEDNARRIESARAQGLINLRGTAYLFVHAVDGNTVKATPVHATIDIVESNTGKVLSTFNL